jgi:hypothetical protein
MLVTFNSQGAAVERIELASPRYRDLEDRSGYLGHLALKETPSGKCEVRVVGAGTPAALAVETTDATLKGLQPGDVITSVDGTAVNSLVEYEAALAETKAGQTIDLGITRPAAKSPLVFRVELIDRPLEVVQPEWDRPAGGQKLPPGEKLDKHPLSLLTTLVGPSTGKREAPKFDPLRQADWEMEVVQENGHDVVKCTFLLGDRQAEELGLSGPAEVIKRYWLARVSEEDQDNPAAAGYHLNYSLEVINRGQSPLVFA